MSSAVLYYGNKPNPMKPNELCLYPDLEGNLHILYGDGSDVIINGVVTSEPIIHINTNTVLTKSQSTILCHNEIIVRLPCLS